MSKNLTEKLTLSLATALAAAGFASSASGQTDGAAEGSKAARVDMQHVALDLAFDPVQRQASGSARLDFKIVNAAQRVAFDAVGLQVSRVTDAQGKSLSFSTDGANGTILSVDLGKTVPAGRAASIRVEYATTWVNETDPGNIWGSTGKGLRFHSPSATDARRRTQIWSSNAPDSARRWYPSNDVPDDLRTFEIKATVPRELIAVATGRLVSESVISQDKKVYHWRSQVPHQNHRSGIVIGDFREVVSRAGSDLITSYGYPDELDGVQASIERLPDIANWLKAKFDTPIPGDGYNQIFVQELPWTMVSPGLSIATENFVDSKEVHRDFMYLWDDLQSESIAEQWMGVSVAPRNWSDFWLANGISRYLATLYNEEKNGIAEVQLSQYHVFGDHITIKSDWDSGKKTAVAPTTVTDIDQFSSSIGPYIRAGAVLRLLEHEIGRPTLLAAIKRFHADFKGKTATTADFLATLKAVSNRDVSSFAAQWITGFGHPVLTARTSYDRVLQELSIEIDQAPASTDVNGASGSGLFGGKLDIEIDGVIETVALKPESRNTFRFKRTNSPQYVAVDPASHWIATLNEDRSAQANMAAAMLSPTPLLRRKAMIALATEAAKSEQKSEIREQALEIFRSILRSDSYWRLKSTAIGQLRTLAAPAPNGKGLTLDKQTREALASVINGTDRDQAWARFNALTLLGDTRDPAYAPLYTSKLRDPSDRIINAAAIALGKTRRSGAFDSLVALEPHPSWKSQSRISMLDGLGELGDARGIDIALDRLLDTKGARWTLVTPVWDYRLSAAASLKKLGAGRRGHDALLPALETALSEKHVSDSFYLANLMLALGDSAALSSFDRIEQAFKSDKRAVDAISALREQLKQ